VQDLNYDASHPARLGTTLPVGTITESVTVTDNSPRSLERENRRVEELARKNRSQSNLVLDQPSQNVVNLQRRVAGILPVRMDVPRGGRSYRFVRPLVLDEETKITFQYKSK
jgi:hypothetical protein